ncbi:MAG: endolytic transglycosylase MltG [Actinomycetota bacterium]|nr:endolytic transglycosylase MltG [Actinomycetota bacterium]
MSADVFDVERPFASRQVGQSRFDEGRFAESPKDAALDEGQVEEGQVEEGQVEEPADELGLLPAAPVAEAGHRRAGRARPPDRSGRRPLGILVSLGVIAALVAGIFFGGRAIVGLFSTEPAADYSGQGSGTVEIEVPEGASTARIADVLAGSDVVASAQAFLDAASGNADIMTIQPGLYQMRLQMSGEEAVALILDPAARLLERVTIPEGYTVARTIESLADQTEIPLADFQAAVDAPEQLGLPPWSNGQLEGFLYPATYDITPDSTAAEILGAMVAQFNEVAVETGLEANAAAVGLTPYEVLVVSSMVQSEVTLERERSLVARVIYNRLDQNIALGIDATLAYELRINGRELTTEALNTDSPYNTRTRVGLPPTPISNPGQPSIVGALQPAPGDYLYYVLQNVEGEHLFTASYDEFLAAKAQCEAAGLGCG